MYQLIDIRQIPYIRFESARRLVDIIFPTKPSAGVLQALKTGGFQFQGKEWRKTFRTDDDAKAIFALLSQTTPNAIMPTDEDGMTQPENMQVAADLGYTGSFALRPAYADKKHIAAVWPAPFDVDSGEANEAYKTINK